MAESIALGKLRSELDTAESVERVVVGCRGVMEERYIPGVCDLILSGGSYPGCRLKISHRPT